MRTRLTAACAVILTVAVGALGVTPARAETSSTASYAVMGGAATPTRWDPCRPITWKLAGRVTPAKRREAVAAMRQVRRATGLAIRYAGMASAEETRSVPTGTIVVQFLAKREPQPGAAGVANVAFVGPYQNGQNRIVWAHVKIGEAARDGHRGYMNVLLHELGHAVGLDHSGHDHSVMWWMQGPVTRFSRGDLAGLRKVGAKRGCLAEPAPVPPVPTTTEPPIPETTVPQTTVPVITPADGVSP
jgi:hypothetical protein